MIRGLDRARWALLSPYLDEAFDVPATARAAWLEALRMRDAGLAAELEELLAEYDEIEEDFLERPPAPRRRPRGVRAGRSRSPRASGAGARAMRREGARCSPVRSRT